MKNNTAINFFVIELFLLSFNQYFENDWKFINHDLFFSGQIFPKTLPFPVSKISK